jgi:pSer/pThr/pTyr-binding forkhead associated (FHA) protein
MLKKIFGRKGSDKEEEKLMNKILGEGEAPEGGSGGGEPMTQKQAPVSDRLAEIDVLVNGAKEQTYPLFPGRLLVGRDPAQVDLVISELIVSKSHCTFLVSNAEVLLRDNGSTNGTYVQGEVVKECRITEDVLVSLGKKGVVQLHVRFLGQRSSESEAGDTLIM